MYITEILLARKKQVKTLTNRPDRPNKFDGHIAVAPYNFDDPVALKESLRGAHTLYNTYWARFAYGKMSYDKAVENTRILINAAHDAGLQRIVQITVMNASQDSPNPYFLGKGQIEEIVMSSGISYTILRPCMIFGPNGILVNNIAWLLRRFPFFAVPGDGLYKVSPIYVGDLAELAVKSGETAENQVIDAAGPETITFNMLIQLIKYAIHSKALIIHTPPEIALLMAKMAGIMVHDIVLEQWEIDALQAGLLCSDAPPVGNTRLSDWLIENAEVLGKRYF
ncbi:MAG: SDR family oxidoreductase, partial [Coriobacteriia bacterium]